MRFGGRVVYSMSSGQATALSGGAGSTGCAQPSASRSDPISEPTADQAPYSERLREDGGERQELTRGSSRTLTDQEQAGQPKQKEIDGEQQDSEVHTPHLGRYCAA